MAGLCHLFPVLFLVLEQVRERQDLVYIYVRKSEEAMYMRIDHMDLYTRLSEGSHCFVT